MKIVSSLMYFIGVFMIAFNFVEYSICIVGVSFILKSILDTFAPTRNRYYHFDEYDGVGSEEVK